ncbi:alpha/beta hydrolase [Corticibacterium sp. UT-5YL-CI-8]|nr:alpha/beta hydrolase [Tianweitania sp. UT-5YL-CI-8]
MKLRYFIMFGLLLAAGVVALSLYRPPMRLMPTPAVFLDGNNNIFSAKPEVSNDPSIELFYATNRLPVGPQDNRLYAVVPGRDMHVGISTIRIGDEATTWDRIYEWSTRAERDDRPYLHLRSMNEQATLEKGEPLSLEAVGWFAEIDAVLEKSRDKDVIVYVHGANTTVERAAGQAAQLRHFTGRDSVVVLFVWPTAENFLRYSRDMLTAFGAAPHLKDLIELLAANTKARNVNVFTYSAGATVGSDALAMLGRDAAQPGTQDPRLGEIYHAAPDADFRQFVDDMRDYAGQADRTTVAVNLNDSALRLSQFVNRASRAGRPDLAELSPEATEWLLQGSRAYGLEVLRVRPENMPDLSRTSHTFWYDDPWVSSDVLMTMLFHLAPDARGLEGGEAPEGTRYWTFMPDYPQRLAGVTARLRAAMIGAEEPMGAPKSQAGR